MRHKRALATILELAKAHRDLCDRDHERRRWERVVGIAYRALGEPNMAQIDKWLRDPGFEDLAASGGIVDAP